MLRRSYFQSTENPTQVDRLPLIRTRLEFPAKARRDGQSTNVCTVCLFAPLAAVLALTVHLCGAFLRDAFGMFLWGLALLLLVSLVIELLHCRFNLSGIHRRSGYYLAAAVTFVSLQFSLPVFLQAAIAAITLGYLAFSFGNHWATYCTASPLERIAARDLRRNYRGFLAVMAACPLALLCISALLGGSAYVLLALPVASVLVGVEVFFYAKGQQSLRHLTEAWRNWLNYRTAQVRLPGVFHSPSGDHQHRLLLTAVTLFGASLPFAHSLAGRILWRGDLTEEFWAVIVEAVSLLFVPLMLVLLVPLLATFSVVIDAARHCRPSVTPKDWPTLMRDIRDSSDPIERDSIYVGRNVHDGSPLLVPRGVFSEHAHFLGDSGSGKTSLGLAPLIEQLATGKSCSLVVIDLKADSLELYATLAAAAVERQRLTGEEVPLKQFTSEPDLSTYAFNPFCQPSLADMDLYLKTDILCSALGLDYGTDYGEGYYSSANAAVLYQTLKRNPEIKSLREAAERVRYLVTHSSSKELPSSTKSAGDHVHMVLDRLGSLDALNVVPEVGYDGSIVNESIDLSQLFLSPQLLYFHLPSTLAPHTAPEIARLVVSSLLVTAKRTERRHPVYLVIDEFQRMVAKNLEMVLQIARSMGVPVILANQTMQDLQGSRSNLIPAIEGNCRYRQWFSVSLAEDRAEIERGSGQAVETLMSQSVSTHQNGSVTTSHSRQQTILPRLSTNDLLLCSDHPNHSIVRISRGDGYAQFGGMSCLVESTYHISEEEYLARKKRRWPTAQPGTFIPRVDKPRVAEVAKVQGPVMTSEVVGGPVGATAKTSAQRKKSTTRRSNAKPAQS